MKLPASLLLAVSTAALSAGCLTPSTAAPLPQPEVVEVVAPESVAEPAPEVVEVVPDVVGEEAVPVKETVEHDPDYCPPCGRG